MAPNCNLIQEHDIHHDTWNIIIFTVTFLQNNSCCSGLNVVLRFKTRTQKTAAVDKGHEKQSVQCWDLVSNLTNLRKILSNFKAKLMKLFIFCDPKL